MKQILKMKDSFTFYIRRQKEGGYLICSANLHLYTFICVVMNIVHNQFMEV